MTYCFWAFVFVLYVLSFLAFCPLSVVRNQKRIWVLLHGCYMELYSSCSQRNALCRENYSVTPWVLRSFVLQIWYDTHKRCNILLRSYGMAMNEWRTSELALAYLARADSLLHRTKGEAVLLAVWKWFRWCWLLLEVVRAGPPHGSKARLAQVVGRGYKKSYGESSQQNEMQPRLPDGRLLMLYAPSLPFGWKKLWSYALSSKKSLSREDSFFNCVLMGFDHQTWRNS